MLGFGSERCIGGVAEREVKGAFPLERVICVCVWDKERAEKLVCGIHRLRLIAGQTVPTTTQEIDS